MKKILCIVGTRPEAIKMAPVILALKKEGWAETQVLATAQHREMLDQVLRLFSVRTDIDLNIMRPDQTLAELTSRLIIRFDQALEQATPDIVLAQGDTTTVMTAALGCYYRRIPFGHVEAGLRTGDLYNPFPEEANRVVAGHLAHWQFAPTEQAKANLLREGIGQDLIHVTGNTVIDALLSLAPNADSIGVELDLDGPLILVTAHRRENFGQPLMNILQALKEILKRRPDVRILYPVHPNPNISVPVRRELSSEDRITLCSPLDYLPFVAAMKTSYLILTDSGGVQEEAPALGKPVLVLRSETERPEAVEAGVARLVGTNTEDIVDHTLHLLTDESAYRAMAVGASPYGDGKAARRIVEILRREVSQ